jgi:glyoxylase-like metal-dependent hydrolase (beta-lactamase superfamily II)
MWISEDSRKSRVKESTVRCSSTIERRPGAYAAGVPCSPAACALGLLRSTPLSLTPDPWRLTPVLAFCLLVSAHSLFAAKGLYEVREVTPNVFVWIPDDVLDQEADPQFSRAGTAGFIITPEGVVVVDTANSPFHGREILYEIRQRTEAPVKYVINTSSAGDHMLGNEVFVDQQATLISTSAAQAQMRRYQEALARRLEDEDGWRLQARMRGFHVTLATQTFRGEMALRLGGQEIRLLSLLGPGQPAEDTVVYLPGAKVLFLGDLFRNGFFPRIGSRDIRRWIETLRQVETWNVETYVPGHGAPGGKKELAEFRGFLEWLAREVEARIRQGKPFDQVKKEVQPSETYHWHAPELAPSSVEGVYKQLVAQPSASGLQQSERQ